MPSPAAPIIPTPTLPSQLTSYPNASGIENNQQQPAGHQDLCPTSHTITLLAGRLLNNHSEKSDPLVIDVVYRAEMPLVASAVTSLNN